MLCSFKKYRERKIKIFSRLFPTFEISYLICYEMQQPIPTTTTRQILQQVNIAIYVFQNSKINNHYVKFVSWCRIFIQYFYFKYLEVKRGIRRVITILTNYSRDDRFKIRKQSSFRQFANLNYTSLQGSETLSLQTSIMSSEKVHFLNSNTLLRRKKKGKCMILCFFIFRSKKSQAQGKSLALF